MNYATSPYWQAYEPPSLETQNAALAGLRGLLHQLTERFAAAYGAPAQLVKAEPIFGKARNKVLLWLHDMANVARRLILLRAMQMEKPPHIDAVFVPPEPVVRSLPPREAADLGRIDDPAFWRVRFCAGGPCDAPWLRDDLGKRTRAARPALHAGYYDCDPRPLAQKFEAILRVLEDLDLHAARLAARLHRWKGRAHKLEQYLDQTAGKALIANAAALEESAWEEIVLARPVMRNMVAGYLRIEDTS